MRRALASIVTAALLALAAGCRSDPTPAALAASRPANARIAATISAAAPSRPSSTEGNAAPTEPLIYCFGDSLTAGYGIEDPDRAYPAVLERKLSQEGFHYHVVNGGVSGETTKDGLARLPRVVARHPDIVVLEFGGNDGLRGLPVAQAQANLAVMIERLQAAHITVALAGISLPPQYGSEYIHRFNVMYPALAAKYHVPLVPMLLTHVYDRPGSMQADGVHPTAQGAAQVAENVESVLKPMLRH